VIPSVCVVVTSCGTKLFSQQKKHTEESNFYSYMEIPLRLLSAVQSYFSQQKKYTGRNNFVSWNVTLCRKK
jgi:hypothetical protein